MVYNFASSEPLEVIRADECNHAETRDLTAKRFKAVFNEIDRLRAALTNVRGYIVNCDHEPAVDEIDAALKPLTE